MQKDKLDQWGGSASFFSISYMLKSRNRVFNPYFFNQYLPNVNSLFVDNSRAKPTTFSEEKVLFSLKLLSGHFYGQSCIKTVRGAGGVRFKTVSMIRKYYNHTLQTNPWHRGEEPQNTNNHKSMERQLI